MYEILEKTSFEVFPALGLKVMEYFPSLSVTTPVLLPSTITVEPMTGSPLESLTVPLTVMLFWAKASPEMKSNPVRMQAYI